MTMRLGVVSDTHGHLANTREAVRRLVDGQVEQVIHCGDIGSADVIPLFARWPTHFVFGNVDRNHGQLRKAIVEAEQTCHDLVGRLELSGRRIAFLHGDDSKTFCDMLDSGEWDLLCYGHTHRPDWRRIQQTWVLNPGAVFRARPHSVAIVELPALERRLVTF